MTAVVIVGASGRAAAQSARRAGFVPYVCDLFADTDTVRDAERVVRCPIDQFPHAIPELIRAFPPGPVLCVGGMENHPDVVERIAESRALLGSSASAMRLVRDPFAWTSFLRLQGLPAALVARHEFSSTGVPTPRSATHRISPDGVGSEASPHSESRAGNRRPAFQPEGLTGLSPGHPPGNAESFDCSLKGCHAPQCLSPSGWPDKDGPDPGRCPGLSPVSPSGWKDGRNVPQGKTCGPNAPEGEPGASRCPQRETCGPNPSEGEPGVSRCPQGGTCGPAASEGEPDPPRWLIKPLRSGGGLRVRLFNPATDTALSPHYYLQQFVPGRVMSALFRNHELIGVAEQFPGEPFLHAAPFHFAAAVAPVPVAAAIRDTLQRIGTALASWADLHGLWGLDFIMTGETITPIEINPRYTATVELYERALAASDGRQPVGGTPQSAKGVYYAPRRLTFPPVGPWTDSPHHADVPAPGSIIDPGHPVLTLFAETVEALKPLAAELDRLWPEVPPP